MPDAIGRTPDVTINMYRSDDAANHQVLWDDDLSIDDVWKVLIKLREELNKWGKE